MDCVMKHPVYNRAVHKRNSNAPWVIMMAILLIILVIPWILPSQMSEKQPFSTIKEITTFNLEYEWHHSTKNIQKVNETSEPNQSDETPTTVKFFQ